MNQDPDPSPERGVSSRGKRRWLRKVLFVLLALVLLVVATVVILLSPGVRPRLLDFALEKVDGALPGALTVGQAAWPSLGSIDLTRVLWTDGADTLLAADHAVLSLRVRALLERDLSLSNLSLTAIRVDGEAIGRRFPDSNAKDSPAGKERGTVFPRQGSLSGIPSVLVERCTITASVITLPDGTTIKDIDLLGSVDLLRNGNPMIRVERLAFQNPSMGWGIGAGSLEVDLGEGIFAGAFSGWAASDLPLDLTLVSASRDSFDLSVTLGDSGDALSLLTARGKISRDQLELRGLEFTAHIQTPGVDGLLRIPAFQPALKSLPDLEGLGVGIMGKAQFKPRFEGEVEVALEQNTWMDGGFLRADFQGQDVTLDSLALDMEELHLEARGFLKQDEVSGEGRVRITGTRWIQIFSRSEAVPDSLWANLRLNVHGPSRSPVVTASLQAAGRQNEFVLERMELNGEIPLDAAQPARFDTQVWAREHRAVLRGEVQRGEPLRVRLDPLLVVHGSGPAPRLSSSPAGAVSWTAQTGRLEWNSVRVTGDLGEIVLDGRLSRDGLEEARIDGQWSQVPLILEQGMALEDSVIHRLARELARRPARLSARWTGTSPPSERARIQGSLSVPGPRIFASLLPEDATVSDWGDIRGSFAMDLEIKPAPVFSGWFSLEETDWLDRASVHFRGEDGDVFIDSAAVALDGFTTSLNGVVGKDSLDVRTRATVDGVRLASRFAPAAAESLEATADLRLAVTGTREAPRVHADLEGSVRRGDLEIPGFLGQLDLTKERLRATLSGPGGLRADDLVLDRWSLDLGGSGISELFPVQLRIEASGPEAFALGRFDISRENEIDIRTDTLEVSFQGLDLRSARSFRVTMDPERQHLVLAGLDLRGTMGTVTGNGFTGRDSSDLRLDVAVALPSSPPRRTWPPELWPNFLEMQLRAGPGRNLGAKVTAGGLRLDPQTVATASLELTTEREETKIRVRLADSDRIYLSGDGAVPGGVSLYPFTAMFRDGDIRFGAVMDALPVPLAAFGAKVGGELPAQVDAHVQVGGSLHDPAARVRGRMRFPNWPRLAEYAFLFDSRLLTPRAVDPGLLSDTDLETLLTEPAPGDSGITSVFRLEKSGRVLVRGQLAYPRTLTPDSLALDQTPIRVSLDSEMLALADFDALLPSGSHISGDGRFRLSAVGPPKEAVLEGAILTRELLFSTAEGTRAKVAVNLAIKGTTKKPSVRGSVEVLSGAIRIPDPPKTLHPVLGTSVLWELSDTTITHGDVTQGDRKEAPPPGETPVLDLDVQVTIPSGLWIRGRDLNVELGGSLSLVQRGALPTVAGTLKALQGRLLFLGRTFIVERGTVAFYGEDEVNPSLDLLLTCRVQETRVNINLEGTILEPQVTLTSDPEMQEGDIMSVLLFGRPLDDLDTDQVGLLQTRASEIAATMATSQLEARLSRQLGVDMLTLKRGEGEDSDRVVLGKYLSRRALLKYEQALESGIKFFINLEYMLTRHLKLETLIGPQSQSAVEVNWSTEY